MVGRYTPSDLDFTLRTWRGIGGQKVYEVYLGAGPSLWTDLLVIRTGRTVCRAEQGGLGEIVGFVD